MATTGLKSLDLRKSLPLFTSSLLLAALIVWVLPVDVQANDQGHSPVRVVFFKGFDHKNRPVELLPGGHFFHVAVQIEDDWYHASTTYGVEPIANLLTLTREGMQVHSMLESRDWTLTKKDIEPYIGLPFDYFYEWECEYKTDCTKYIAQLLDVSPTATDFSADHWRVSYGVAEGGLGVSPDELYTRLKQKKFYNISPRFHLRSKSSSRFDSTSMQCQSLLN